MALTPLQIRRRARTGLAGVLRLLADVLRPDDEVIASGDADADTREAPPSDEDDSRFGAAAYVDAHQKAEPEPEPASSAPDLTLLSGLSGDMGPAMAERARESQERSSGGDADEDAELSALRDEVVDMLHTIYDPEIPVDIYDLGLIYAVDISSDRFVDVTMTLTAPNCPAAQSLPAEIETKVSAVPGVAGATVDVTFDPPWTPDLMSEEAKLELNIA